MTRTEFICLCNSNYISPDIALENDDVCAALRARDDETLISLIKNQF